jgi:DNA polymerase III subunit alpha
MGFPAYFLIVWDLIRHARERGIRTGPGLGARPAVRSSRTASASPISILSYGLIFERFLNTGRREMPDIDMDFDERYRGEMIRYAAERYGSDHVAQIITFSTIKGARRCATRPGCSGSPTRWGTGWPSRCPRPSRAGGIDRAVPRRTGAGADGSPGLLRQRRRPAQMYEQDPDAKRVIDTARGLEGLRRQDSIHAAAVVISPEPLTDIVPIQQKGEDAEVVTQFEMHAIEEARAAQDGLPRPAQPVDDRPVPGARRE